MRRRHSLKTATAVFLVVLICLCGFGMCHKNDVRTAEEVRGVWVSYVDFGKLGLSNKTENEFRENARLFFEKAEELHVNTIYFHVRAFRDATYVSEYFPVSKAIWSRSDEMPYDPLEIMTEMAHSYDMELHAWLNPYRNSSFEEEILDPADQSSTEDILLCVREIIENYDVDGIHFDDYFYEEDDPLETQAKMVNVNRMIRRVYDAVHKENDRLVFGISPAGNIGYSESLGADVRTWLSEDGYVDYIIPQIYWTDEHTATWRDDMYSDTLDEWVSINENEIPMYIGLALYKAGIVDETDPGWIAGGNIEYQISRLREKGCAGYAFFSASDFFRAGADNELMLYQNLVF